MFNISSDAPVFVYTSLGIFRDQKTKSEYCLDRFSMLNLEFTPIDLAVIPKDDVFYVRQRYAIAMDTGLPILIASGGTYHYDEIFEMIEDGSINTLFEETSEWNFVDVE